MIFIFDFKDKNYKNQTNIVSKGEKMKKIKQFFIDFKKFISRGNVLDLAVALVVGTAFTKIVSSLVNDLIMPLICAIFGTATVDQLYFTLNGAQVFYGRFLQAVIDFLLVAIVLFIILRIVMNASNAVRRSISEKPTKAEKKILQEQGVNMKDHKAVITATKELREKNKVVEEVKPTTEELLSQILLELKKQNESVETKQAEERKDENFNNSVIEKTSSTEDKD